MGLDEHKRVCVGREPAEVRKRLHQGGGSRGDRQIVGGCGNKWRTKFRVTFPEHETPEGTERVGGSVIVEGGFPRIPVSNLVSTNKCIRWKGWSCLRGVPVCDPNLVEVQGP